VEAQELVAGFGTSSVESASDRLQGFLWSTGLNSSLPEIFNRDANKTEVCKLSCGPFS
jgi:hypothetical protein